MSISWHPVSLCKRGNEELRKESKLHLKLGQIGSWRRTLMLIMFSLLCNNTARARISHDDAFVGYSEHPLIVNPGKSTLQHNYVIFSTQYGDIKVKLAELYSPLAVNYMKSLITRGITKGCSFYRVEPSGPTIDEGREDFRQGYALVQGGLYSCGHQETNQLPIENGLNLTKGSVSLITGTSEFFFNIEAHPEWDGLFSVWGEVVGIVSWHTLHKIVGLPTRQEVHSSGTVLRMLLSAVPFEAKLA